MSGSAYYEGLTDLPDPARAAGWRRRLGQAARFEAALAPVRAGDRLLDLGCGPGGLFAYLAARGPAVRYFGMDVLPGMIARARRDHPDGTFLCGDALGDVLPPAELVVAVGTLVSGESLRSDGVRLGRLRRLAERAWAAATAAVILVVLDQQALEGRPALAAEPALGGAREAEARWLGERLGATVDVLPVLRTDLAIVLWRDTSRSQAMTDSFAACALSGPWGRGVSGAEAAWLWYQAGDATRARAALARGDFPETAETRWLRSALEYEI